MSRTVNTETYKNRIRSGLLRHNGKCGSRYALLKLMGYAQTTAKTGIVQASIFKALDEMQCDGEINYSYDPFTKNLTIEMIMEKTMGELGLEELVHQFLGDIGKIVKKKIEHDIENKLRAEYKQKLEEWKREEFRNKASEQVLLNKIMGNNPITE